VTVLQQDQQDQQDPQSAGEQFADWAGFRRILGHFCTGIVIVTALESVGDGDGVGGIGGGGGSTDAVPVGMTCQSFSSLSLDPPLVMFGASHASTSWPRIQRSGSFAVNILAADQETLCRRFATSGADKFAGVQWSVGTAGAPLLAGCLAHIECRLQSVIAAGDHDIVIGEPLAMGEDPSRDPLLFFRSGYGRFAS
jgi:3-hydroxy-9,10-secoandrosta-1,3,5(10)-triene-9,17-dione monooxygenase reductase component